MRFDRYCAAVLVACGVVAPLDADADATHGTVMAEPGARYRASWLHRAIFGDHWRDAWTTPVEVPVLDLSSFDGGLTPVRRGGGQETNHLRFESANGRTWVFRSVDKEPTRILEDDVRQSLVGEIVQDSTSAAHPLAALVVAPLLDAVGVLHATPRLAVIPDDAPLGPFREFAGMLGLLEERPEHGFPGATKVLDTLELLARLEGRTDERVDARDYLTARLVDILVGDWDRHGGQWRWVRFDGEGERVWRAVPRDRDQAFSRFDGVVPSIAEYYTKQLAGFGPRYPSIEKLTYSGRYTDRRFLVALEKADWDSVTDGVVARLDDAMISAAVHHLPAELYARGGAQLEQTLRARRDGLRRASDEFYRLLAEDVDVYGTIGAEVAVLRASPDAGLDLTLRRRDNAMGTGVGPPLFHRTFRPEETREVRLYLLGGDDRVVDERAGTARIGVRIIANGEGAGGSPSPAAVPPRTLVATTSDELGAVSTKAASQDELRRRFERFRDWGSDTLVFPQLSYDGTRGLFAGARVQWTHFGFGREPFANQMSFAAAWSTSLTQPRLEYHLDLRTPSPARVLFYAVYSGVDFANFFGLGNKSVREAGRERAGDYHLRQDSLVLHPMLEATLLGPLHGRSGVMLEHVSNEGNATAAAIGSYGFGKMTIASAELGLALDTTSGALVRERGFRAEVTLRHYPRVLDNAAAFTKLRAEASAKLGTDASSGALLGLRVAGEKNWGRYPFFEAAFIGGAVSRSALDVTGASAGNLLRGYDLNRFAGDASLVANADLRVPLGKYNAILPMKYGLLGLADVGRVFLANETSGRWHAGAGGGVWFAIHGAASGVALVSSMSFALVRSDEGTTFFFTTAFGI